MNSELKKQIQDVKELFGIRLAEARRKFGTQTELGEELGVTKTAVSFWENGKNRPKGDMLYGIHRLTNVSIDYLFGIHDHAFDYPKRVSDTDSLFKYLWTKDRIEQVERNAVNIWDASPDFAYLTEESAWIDLMINNMAVRHARYYFLYRESDDNKRMVQSITNRLQNEVEEWRMVAHFVPITPDKFPGWTQHVLYDPFGKEPHCIMTLGRNYQYNDVPYHLEFVPFMRDEFANWFQGRWNEKVNDDPYWKISDVGKI